MDDQKQKEIFSKNLKHYVMASGKTQKEVAKDLGYTYTTFNAWIRGTAIPNAAKIQTIADYFGIGKSMLLDDHDSKPEHGYYLNTETARIAQQIYDDPYLHALFDAAENAKPEDMKIAADLLRRLKGTTPDG